MAKKTEKSAVLTSFHGTVINSTINELTRSIGEPQYDAGRDDWGFNKTTVEWTCELKMVMYLLSMTGKNIGCSMKMTYRIPHWWTF
jgi:hypothetical protein